MRCAAVLMLLAWNSSSFAATLIADPPSIALDGPQSRLRMLIHTTTPSGRIIDRTAVVKYISADERIAQISREGVVLAIADGATTITASGVEGSITIPVTITGTTRERRLHFGNDIEPIFGRHGCAAAGCHGKAEGQNGFKLSVFGYDPAADYASLLKESRGRRLFPSVPERSLLLTKASGQVPHGGGLRIPVGSESYRTLRTWIAAGMPQGDRDAATLASIVVEPPERVLDFATDQTLRVMATYSDGRRVDVTHQARFQSNNEAVASVTGDGIVRALSVPGDAVIMAAFLNEVAVMRVIVPRPGTIPESAFGPAKNFIDPLVDARLRRLNIAPSGPVDDAEFLRRVSLDLIGLPPKADEARQFLADTSPAKRDRLISTLLARPEFADLWAMRWADLLRVDRSVLGHSRAYAYHRWIRDSIAQNKPLDRFAREIVTAEGPLDEVGPANFYKVVTKPGERSSSLSQVLMGVRVGCAECHHHPFDRWGQGDYHGMAAFFAPVSSARFGSVEAIMASGSATAIHPRTGTTIRPTLLGGAEIPTMPSLNDPRGHLANWLTAPDNPYFARNLANRVWAHLMGRGLVEPVDDHRATNPPTNPALLDALAKYLIESKYDLRALIQVIVQSRTYQTSSHPNESNARDEQNFSRALLKRLEAEVLADTIARVTGVEDRFQGMPRGSRAVQVWDSKVASDFLRLFGRPTRTGVCTCDRMSEATVAQVLHLMNAPEMQDRLSHADGMIARLTRIHTDYARLSEELYLTILGRFPTKAEQTAVVGHLTRDPQHRREAAEDVAWSLINSLEFALNH